MTIKVKSSKLGNYVLLLCLGWLLAGIVVTFMGGCGKAPAPPAGAHRLSGVEDSLPLHNSDILPLVISPANRSTTVLLSDLPARDLADLAARLIPSLGDPLLTCRPVNVQHKVGDKESFWISDQSADGGREIEATLRCITPHLYMWLEDGLEVSQEDLESSARVFEELTYPTNHRYFGLERSPGIDGDVHLSVLNASFQGASGYFNSADGYSCRIYPYSNEREMVYINVEAVRPGTSAYQSTLAHEFQHIIHWHADPNEETWVNEGASELATSLNGFKENGRITAFAQSPDTQLNTWGEGTSSSYEHYGAAHLMVLYFYERFDEGVLRDLISCQDKGIAGFDAILGRHGTGYTFEDLYADWVVANYLDDVSIGDVSIGGGKYGYRTLSKELEFSLAGSHAQYPASESDTVHQFGTDYVEILPNEGDVAIEFEGASTVHLVANQPYDGEYQWWSNRGDLSDTKLTRAFDLRGVEKATLEYALWYDIEPGWDYAYVEVSTDGGHKWSILRGHHSTDFNPNGIGFGWAYTGISGEGQGPHWVREQVDLTPYVGQEVQVRFEYVTDDAVNRDGLCIDDIAVPEIGYHSGAEEDDDDGGWVGEGFVRTDNILPQRFLVQVIEFSGSGKEVEVHRIPLEEDRHGRIIIEGFGSRIERVVLVISGITPLTTQLAPYRYHIEELSEHSQ